MVDPFLSTPVDREISIGGIIAGSLKFVNIYFRNKLIDNRALWCYYWWCSIVLGGAWWYSLVRVST